MNHIVRLMNLDQYALIFVGCGIFFALYILVWFYPQKRFDEKDSLIGMHENAIKIGLYIVASSLGCYFLRKDTFDSDATWEDIGAIALCFICVATPYMLMLKLMPIKPIKRANKVE